jgi:hypothetical protein
MRFEVIGGSSANLAPEEDVGLCPEGAVRGSEKATFFGYLWMARYTLVI